MEKEIIEQFCYLLGKCNGKLLNAAIKLRIKKDEESAKHIEKFTEELRIELRQILKQAYK